MLLTLLLSIMMMAGMFILLLAGVGLVQDKKFFNSAPKEVQEAVLPREERFPGAHVLGYILAVFGMLCMGAALPFQFLSAFLSRDNAFTGTTFVRL